MPASFICAAFGVIHMVRRLLVPAAGAYKTISTACRQRGTADTLCLSAATTNAASSPTG